MNWLVEMMLDLLLVYGLAFILIIFFMVMILAIAMGVSIHGDWTWFLQP